MMTGQVYGEGLLRYSQYFLSWALVGVQFVKIQQNASFYKYIIV